MKRILCILLLVLVLLGAIFLPAELLQHREQALYGSQVAVTVPGSQTGADSGELISRLSALAYHATVVPMDTILSPSEQEAWLGLFQRELSVLGESCSMFRNLEAILDDIMDWSHAPDLSMMGFEMYCAVDLETGESFLLQVLRIPEFSVDLVIDTSSGKLIYAVAAGFEQESSLENRQECAEAFASYLGLICGSNGEFSFIFQDEAQTGYVHYWIDEGSYRVSPM